MSGDESRRPLGGIRVIGLEQYVSAPYCTLALADAGAEVIKIERPGTGDPRRQIPPFAEAAARRMGVGFMSYNRNKKSVALDLKTETGRSIYRELVGNADIVVENLRPGSVDRLGLGYDALSELNPRLIYAVISGFGRLPDREGPFDERPSFDIVAEAMGGIMHVVGFEDKPPSPTVYGMPDIFSGLAAAYGVALALIARATTGRGQFVDSAMYDNMISLNEGMVALRSVTGRSPERGRPRALYPRGAFATRDGFIAFTIPDETMWRRACDVMGRPDLIDDERSRTGPARAANRAFLDPIVESFFAELTRDEAVERLVAAGVPAGPIQTADDLFACPQLAARGTLMSIEYPDLGEFQFARTPLQMSDAPDITGRPAPELGQHTHEVLSGLLGYESTRISELAAAGVIGTT
ncbi:MAG: CoA transferase [Gemmatimonadetes bacterium]|nr:CoA transferase [Gemmatimonadota bacterium]